MTARVSLGRIAALAVALLLGACSSGGPTYLERLGAAIKDRIAPPRPRPPREFTRAEFDEIPFATITVAFGEGARAILVPLADNGGYLDYRDASNRGIRILGGAVAGSEGLGLNLEAVRHDRRDPVAYPRPLADWPESVFREYQYRVREAEDYGITLACSFQVVARETVEIVEIDFDVARVSEVCTNQARQVINTYWVEEETGFIWKSEQWLGPVLGHARIEVIRPYAG
jgi:hypothetical protein